MSLKAKIEAVIYASDEPVTLAQLVGLLGEEAQAALDRAAEAQATLALGEAEVVLPTHGGEGAMNGAPGSVVVRSVGSVDSSMRAVRRGQRLVRRSWSGPTPLTGESVP